MISRLLLLVLGASTLACARPVPVVAAPARLDTPGAMAVALAAARDSAAPCDPAVQVAEVHNARTERAWVSIVTSAGTVFLPDDALAADAVQWYRLPRHVRAVRAEASPEPWKAVATTASTGARPMRFAQLAAVQRPTLQAAVAVPVRMACPR